MIKFLGPINMKKLDLKHEPTLRRVTFLDWIGQLKIAFSSDEYTIEVLEDYSTTTKIRIPKDLLADSLFILLFIPSLIKTPGQALPFVRIKVHISLDVCTQNVNVLLIILIQN